MGRAMADYFDASVNSANALTSVQAVQRASTLARALELPSGVTSSRFATHRVTLRPEQAQTMLTIAMHAGESIVNIVRNLNDIAVTADSSLAWTHSHLMFGRQSISRFRCII